MRILFSLIAAAVVLGGAGYVMYVVIERYGDNPLMLMTLMVPVVAVLFYMLQVMRR